MGSKQGTSSTRKSNVISFEKARKASSDRARDIMIQEKLALQELSMEFYQLLLDEYKHNVSSDPTAELDLQLLLNNQIADPVDLNSPQQRYNRVENFCYKYRLTIEQYCRLQTRLREFPKTLSEWQKLNQQAKQYIQKC